MKRWAAYTIMMGIALLFTIHVSGCTAIGFGIGYAIDKSHHPTVDSEQILGLAPGTRISLTLRDGSVQKGEYRGFEFMSRADYEPLYAHSCETIRPHDAPALGDTMTFHRADSTSTSGIFEGFGPRSIAFQPESGGDLGFRPVTGYVVFTTSSGEFRSSELYRLDLDGSLPSRAVIRLASGKGTTTIPTDRVAKVALPSTGSGGRIAGTLLGALADLVVVVGAVQASNEVNSECGGGGY